MPVELLGDYVLEGELGRGSMGLVYRARHAPTGATRALKVLGSCDLELLARFRREAEALARVGGDVVVPVHEIGVAQGKIFFAMGFMPGGSLGARLARGPLPWREAVKLGVALAHALDRCHASGVIHRDIKPDNILFDEDGRPRLADFGLAKDLMAPSGLTESGTLIGTPAYMPPEQFSSGKRVDARTDVYALATVLHETISGVRPFDGATLADLFGAKRNDRRPPLPPPVPRTLDLVLARAMSAAPEVRQPSARAFADELAAVLAEKDAKPRLLPRVASVALLAAAALVAVFVLAARRDDPSPPPPDAASPPDVTSPRSAHVPAPPPGPREDLAAARVELLAAAQAIRLRQSPAVAIDRVKRAREACRGSPLPAEVASVISAAYERIEKDARETSPLLKSSQLTSRFQDVEDLLALARSLGATFRVPVELADVALAVGDARKSSGHDWRGVFDAGLIALEANPEIAEQLTLWCVEWVQRMHGPAAAVRTILAQAVAAAPPGKRPGALLNQVEFFVVARELEGMVVAATAALRELHDDEHVDQVARLLVSAAPSEPVDPALLDALVAAAPRTPDFAFLRARLDRDRGDDLLRAVEEGLRAIDRKEAVLALAAEPQRIRARARSLVLAGRPIEASLLLEKSADPELQHLSREARLAVDGEKRAALARRLEPP